MAKVLRSNLQLINDIFIEEIMDKIDQESLKFFKECFNKDQNLFNSVKMKVMFNDFIQSEIKFFMLKFGKYYRLFLKDLMKGNMDPLILKYKNKLDFRRIKEQLSINPHLNNITISKDNRDCYNKDIDDELVIDFSESLSNINEIYILNIELRNNNLTKNSIFKFIRSINKFENMRSVGLDFGCLENFDDYLLNELCKVLLKVKYMSALALSFHKFNN